MDKNPFCSTFFIPIHYVTARFYRMTNPKNLAKSLA